MDTNLESNSLVAEANNRRRKKESIQRDKSFSSLVSLYTLQKLKLPHEPYFESKMH